MRHDHFLRQTKALFLFSFSLIITGMVRGQGDPGLYDLLGNKYPSGTTAKQVQDKLKLKFLHPFADGTNTVYYAGISDTAVFCSTPELTTVVASLKKYDHTTYIHSPAFIADCDSLAKSGRLDTLALFREIGQPNVRSGGKYMQIWDFYDHDLRMALYDKKPLRVVYAPYQITRKYGFAVQSFVWKAGKDSVDMDIKVQNFTEFTIKTIWISVTGTNTAQQLTKTSMVQASGPITANETATWKFTGVLPKALSNTVKLSKIRIQYTNGLIKEFSNKLLNDLIFDGL